MIDSHESITAKLCSFARAYHASFERQKIFDDYLAYDLIGNEEYQEIGQLIENGFQIGKFDSNRNFDSETVYPKLNRYISPIPLSRIAFAEEELRRFAKENTNCQYVICGAGMDTFAFRNKNPNIKIFEIDHPDTQKYKLKRVRSLEWNIPKNVHYVAVDFSKDDMRDALEKAGFNNKIPTFFSILGVTYYLELSVFEDTLKKINSISAAGSKTVFDFYDGDTFKNADENRFSELAQITKKLGEPMKQGFQLREIENSLLKNGFSIDKHSSPKAIQNRFFQNRIDGQKAFQNIHFISAKKTK